MSAVVNWQLAKPSLARPLFKEICLRSIFLVALAQAVCKSDPENPSVADPRPSKSIEAALIAMLLGGSICRRFCLKIARLDSKSGKSMQTTR